MQIFRKILSVLLLLPFYIVIKILYDETIVFINGKEILIWVATPSILIEIVKICHIIKKLFDISWNEIIIYTILLIPEFVFLCIYSINRLSYQSYN